MAQNYVRHTDIDIAKCCGDGHGNDLPYGSTSREDGGRPIGEH